MLADLKYRLRALLRRDTLDRELADELSFHIEREVEKHVRAGVTRAEAERRARVEFGGVEQITEDTRTSRGLERIDALLQDVRYAWRGVRSRPGFSAAVVLTLGLGIGANAAMFGVVDRLLLRPPAFLSDADRVHRAYLNYMWDGAQRTDRNFEYIVYTDVTSFATSFDAAAAFSYQQMPVGRGTAARELMVARVSASYFDFFTARPVLGRFFTAQEDVPPAGENVAVLGYAYWQSAHGGSRSVLGEQLHIGEVTYTVVGVAPRGFVGVTDGAAPVAYIPITTFAYARDPAYATSYGWSWLEMLVRRRPAVAFAAATADMSAAFARSWQVQHEQTTWLRPVSEAKPHATISPVHMARGPDAGPNGRIAAWVMGVAFIVLLIAAANVINLLLARALQRRREIALRLALGVSRARLLQQLLMETLLLALLGGVAGLAAARWGGGMLRALFLTADDADAVATDTRTLLFTATLTLAIALLTGLAPALQALRADVAGALKAGMRDSAYRSSRLRTGLLLFQSALCVLLLVGAGLFVRSLANVRAYRLGYDIDPIVLIDTNQRGVQLDDAQRNELADRLHAAAMSVPGVRSATLAATVPFYSFEGRGPPHVPGRDSLNLLGRYILQSGSSAYFETLGTRILRGRGFTSADVAGAPYVVVVSQAMAHAIWPGQDPLGERMRFGSFGGDTTPYLTVVGIAENVSGRSIGGAPEFWYYLPTLQYRTMFGAARGLLYVRVDGRAGDHVETLRERLQRELPGDSYVRAAAFADVIAPQQRSWRVGATMFVVFAALALVLATIGLYSVIAYAVAQRTRELGVRIALGASVARVVRMVVGQGVLFAITGIAAGSAAALLAARWIEPLLFDASAKDPVVYGAVAVVLLIVAVVATARPALRATRVDPTIALRAE
ncbi:MAG TPA: ADOP family duplicated permease [Longimicrobiales bacterium]|nr:ADOP family duplicated permease [Longimicrobiales bacterium]